MNEYILEMRGITKEFPGVRALDNVNFKVKNGEIHCLVGENGAGKSTLMKVLSGVYKFGSYSGDIVYNGEVQQFQSTKDSENAGIAIISQELALVPELTVYENIFFGHEIMHGKTINWNETIIQAREMLKKVRLDVNPSRKVRELGVGQQQLVEIAKALSKKAKLLILDEPTASLNEDDSQNLLQLLRDLQAEGVTSIMISHRLKEVVNIADTITVLRDGSIMNTWAASDVDHDTLVFSMVGRELKEQFPKVEVPIGETVLKVENLSLAGQYENISFELHKGEILGFAGLIGAGRTELMRSIFGMTQPDEGKIILNGEEVHFKSPRDAIKKGIAYVTEDRKGEGLVLPMSVRHNTTLAALESITQSNGLLDRPKEHAVVDEQIKALNTKVHNPRQVVKSLSGGNQQKVVLAKWMITNPNIIIFDEPTRGIDVGAKAEIYKIMCNYVAQGNAVIMISSEMPEAMGMSDRIIVMSNHKYSGELKREEFTQEAIVQMQFKHM